MIEQIYCIIQITSELLYPRTPAVSMGTSGNPWYHWNHHKQHLGSSTVNHHKQDQVSSITISSTYLLPGSTIHSVQIPRHRPLRKNVNGLHLLPKDIRNLTYSHIYCTHTGRCFAVRSTSAVHCSRLRCTSYPSQRQARR